MLARLHYRPQWAAAKASADNLTDTYSTPPIPVLQIAERKGVDVVFANFGMHTGTVAGFCDFQNAKIFVNREDKAERQTFTIAHELGHWILHREIFVSEPDKYPVLPRFNEPDYSNAFEKEANHFAAHLLVPSRLLAPVSGAPVAAIARAFGVSKTMMEFRLKNE
jgi:Zn-dependent peptidase ImmA (M78 family)